VLRFKGIRRAALMGCGSLLLITAAGSIYQAIATAREQRLYPPPGHLVDAGGYRLHIYCTGEGTPAVIFESGFGMSSNAWALVQPQAAKFSSACSYDRPGYGWSDEPPQPRTGIRAAEDLHRMLANASIPTPYVLVGHSMGGGQVRLFADRFANDVAGLVIVASGHEDWRTRNPAAGVAEEDGVDRIVQAAAILAPFGFSRLIGVLFRPAVAAEYVADLRKYLPARAAESEITFLAQSKHARAMAAEIRDTPKTEESLRHARNFGDTPLIVLSEKWIVAGTPGPGGAEAARVEDELQSEISRFSRKGKHVRVDSGHLIPLEKPDAIVSAIREILTLLKQQ
jgi:pimeloyl-ACP methyl ester carboxylesterase